MNEIVLELGAEKGLNETVFHEAVEHFAKWREDTSTGAYMYRDAPDIIVKTVVCESGQLGKKLIFPDQSWVGKFQAILAKVMG